MRVKTQKKGAYILTVLSSYCTVIYYIVIHTVATVEQKVSWNYYELFQMVLQAQADSLVKLGFKPIVKVLSNCILLNTSLFI